MGRVKLIIYDLLGYDSTILLSNTGVLFMILVILTILLIFISMMSSMCGKRLKCIKSMRDWIYINPFLRIFIEMYLETMLCAIVNILNVRESI